MNPQWIDPARSRVVLVGVPFYADGSLKDFGVIERNVVDLLAVLTDPSAGRLDPSHCTQTEPKASMADIGALLGRAADEATDLLLFYYCGHGLIGGMRDRQLYLSVYHTDKGREAYTALPFEAVRQDFLRSRAARRVVILDCCFSGRIVGGTLSPADQEIAAQVQIDNSYILASAPGDHPALVLDGEPHTAFTHRFLEILKEGKPGPGEALTLADIYQLLESRLIAAGLPRLQALATGGADRLPLVRNRAYAPETGQDHADGSAGLVREQPRLVGGGRGWPPWRRALVVAGCAAAAAGIALPIILSQPGVSADRPGAAHPGQPEASGQPQSASPSATLTDPVAYGGGHVQAVAFSPDGKTVATGDGNGSTYLWDVASPAHPVATLSDPASAGDVSGVAFSPDGKMVATGEVDNGSAYVWDLASPGHPVAILTDPDSITGVGDVQDVAFSPDGRMVATGDGNGSAYVWDLASPGHPVATLTDPDSNPITGGVSAVAFSPDGKMVATGDGNDGAYLWDVASPGHPVATLTDPDPLAGDGGVYALAFSPDGKMVATADGNGSAYLWDVASPAHPVATLTDSDAGGGTVNGVAFSPDGKMVATADASGRAYLWDVASPAHPVATLTDPRSSSVGGVAFSPDGKTVAIVDGSVSAYLWRLGAQSQGHRTLQRRRSRRTRPRA